MTTIIEIQEEIDQLDGWLKTGVVDEATYKKRREPLMAELILETEKVERENARLAATKEAEELVAREQEQAAAALAPKASVARKDDTVEKLNADTKVKKAEHTTRDGIVGWAIILGVGYFAWTGISGAIGWATGDAATDVAETTRPVEVVVARNETTSAITKPQSTVGKKDGVDVNATATSTEMTKKVNADTGSVNAENHDNVDNKNAVDDKTKGVVYSILSSNGYGHLFSDAEDMACRSLLNINFSCHPKKYTGNFVSYGYSSGTITVTYDNGIRSDCIRKRGGVWVATGENLNQCR